MAKSLTLKQFFDNSIKLTFSRISRNRNLGVKTFSVFSIAMFLLGGVLTFKFQFLPSFDVLWRTGTELYIAPWMRITPYCVGVVCGWYLNKYRKTFTASDVRRKTRHWPWQHKTYYVFNFLLQQRVRKFLFSISTFLMLLALHSTIYRDMGVTLASICILVGRPLIAIGVSIFVILNACGYDCEFDCLEDFFAWFQFFSRLDRFNFENFLLETFRPNQQINLRHLPFKPDHYHRCLRVVWKRWNCWHSTVFHSHCRSYCRDLSSCHRFYAAFWNSFCQIVERNS